MVNTTNAGRAYGVFKCSDPRPLPALVARFKEALENVKLAHEETGIPPQTEFSVFDIRSGMTHVLVVEGSDALVEKITVLVQNGANLMIQSVLPVASNAIAARDLGDTLNMLYGGTELFDAENEGREKRVMDVFYKDEKGA